MRALLIEFDLSTGKRAGDINPKDPNLICHAWQNLESTPAQEIRLVNDDRDLSIYDGVPGVTVLEGKAAINEAIQKHIPVRYMINDKDLMMEHMREKKLSVGKFAGKTGAEVAKLAHDEGLAGVMEKKPKLIE